MSSVTRLWYAVQVTNDRFGGPCATFNIARFGLSDTKTRFQPVSGTFAR